MRFTADRDVLVSALSWLSGATAKSESLPILGDVLMEVQDDALYCATTDLAVRAVIEVDVRDTEPGSVVADCVKIRRLIATCGEVISVESTEKLISVSSGDFLGEMFIRAADEFPEPFREFDPKSRFEMEADEFKRLADAGLIFCTPNSTTAQQHHGIMITDKSGRIEFASTDSHAVVACAVGPEYDGDLRLRIVPALKTLKTIRGMGASLSISHSETHLRITDGTRVLWERMNSSKIPGYSGAKLEKGTSVWVSTVDLMRSVRRVAELSRELGRCIEVAVTEEQLTIETQSDTGQARDVIPCVSDGEIARKLNAGHIIDAVSASVTDEIEIVFGERAITIYGYDDGRVEDWWVSATYMMA